MESNRGIDIDTVLQKLSDSIDSLEKSVDFHLGDKKRLSTVNNEISDLMLDRSRLAQSLDKAEARASRLEDANKEVSKRLVNAMDSIRVILETRDEQQAQVT